jgi:fatty acid amide hydrolase
MFTDDGFFPASTAVQRAVLEAAEALRARGAIVEPFQPPRIQETMDTYISLLGADGGAGARRLVGNSQLDWRVARLMWIASLSSPTRWALVNSLKRLGQGWMARLVGLARGRSADSYWRLIHRKNELAATFQQEFRAAGFEAYLCPPHALPAMQHGKPIDLLVAASYAYLANFVGLPAGVVPITRVRAGEDGGRHVAIDKVKRQAAAVDRGSAGLPIGVQVAALPWREDLVLALLRALEEDFQSRDDYPGREVVPKSS